MPLYMISDGITKVLPSQYYFLVAVVLVGLTFLRAWSSGRTNTRERDLHGRTILVTGGLTATGITVLRALAERGAQVVALVPSLSDPLAQLLLPVLQQSTDNPLVFAEECDITSPRSVRAFHAQFVKGKTGTGMDGSASVPRIDAIVFLHEYPHVGVWGLLGGQSRAKRLADDNARRDAALGTFLLTTIFLPFLIRAPADRDIRIVNVVNPLYAAAVTQFDPTATSSGASSISQLEGERSLRSILFARHCQRVLDALATPAAPSTDQDPAHEVVVSKKGMSNIKVVTACPGFARSDTIAPFFGASKSASQWSKFGAWVNFFLSPILFFLAKSALAASQTPLYALFMPHPSKVGPPAPTARPRAGDDDDPVSTIQGGELYRECAPVRLPTERGGWLMSDESVGRAVWEYYEKEVDKWEKEEKERLGPEEDKKEKEKDQPTSVEEPEPESDVGAALPGLKGKLKAS